MEEFLFENFMLKPIEKSASEINHEARNRYFNRMKS